ncbi:MAG: peptidase M15 [Rickettsiaceae bacterium]|nr:peptidase M15 [Rickettsiaceae bacterium]
MYHFLSKISKKNYLILILFLASYNNSYAGLDDYFAEKFSYITQTDPSIIINIRYRSTENILGRSMKGYSKSRPFLTKAAAKALSAAQADLVMQGYSLVLYNAYIPLKSYHDLEKWSRSLDEGEKDEYYPNLTKSELITQNYIKEKKHHSRGSTVDVTIIALDKTLKNPCIKKKRDYQNNVTILYLDDNTVDMGSSYDLFDPISQHDCPLISKQAKRNRQKLRKVMEENGFIANKKFWWQYSFSREPYLDTNFDFDT